MILVAYRHGLRASELCDLQWHQVELAEGRLHVHRLKNGTPSVHVARRMESRRAVARGARNEAPTTARAPKEAAGRAVRSYTLGVGRKP
jgi:integrase